MPTGNCKFPEHHTPATGPPFALLGAIALGALVIAFWRSIVVALVITTFLAVIAGMVFALFHNRHSGYDAELEHRAEVEQLRHRGEVAASPQRPAIEAPAVHNHLHLHGVDAEEMAEAVRKAISR